MSNFLPDTAVIKMKKPRVRKPKVIEEEEAVEAVEVIASIPIDEDAISEISEEKEEEEEEDELTTLNKQIEEIMNTQLAEMLEKKKHLEKKKLLLEKAPEMTLAFIEMRNADVAFNLETIKKLTDENTLFQEQIAEITEIADLTMDNEERTTDNADAIMEWFVTNEADYGNEYLGLTEEEPEVKPKKKKTKDNDSDSEGKKAKGTRTAIDRLACRDLLPDRMVFKASANHKTDKARGKVTMEVVYNASNQKFYGRHSKTEYNLLQDANREWCNARGYDKLGNAWEDFRALNLDDGSTRSIQNIHNENWIKDSLTGAAVYIDRKWNFA